MQKIYRQLYANKMDNLGEKKKQKHKFLEMYNLLKLNKKEFF